MRLIGLLGGMSWQSTAEYYRLLNDLTHERLGGLHSARCVLYSVDFAAIEAMQAEGRWDEAGTALGEAARALEAAGADFVVLCTNTMHKVADRVAAAVGIPLLHLGDTTAEAVKRRGVTTVGLLGTRFTMAEDFYRGRLAGHGLTVLVPSTEDQRIVNDIIYDELCLGIVKPESRDAYRRIIGRLIEDGAEGVIYGCTEIELLVGEDDSAVPVFPTTRLHCEAALDHALRPDPPRRPGLP
ncbi:aspartate racemase [Actinoplanes campanulatus]|uniref:Aspartate racemase n=1 Tax=Actinoplanes campanulatus TaxID=113559 RepID=A0A7W5ART5_9ACTN|nr:aspartate/glutamate racemase family protein [Actinoplanes campanulatus]MBB3101268.1 aspartate racemase [Actinoplanes campanulatus]GGN50829.1 aspartate racemase [Actinoplanes campanulatus]GID42152.1 aspartate racemase [Actinoplanes campanulatus]